MSTITATQSLRAAGREAADDIAAISRAMTTARLRTRLGHRGAILLVLGGLYVVLGWARHDNPPPSHTEVFLVSPAGYIGWAIAGLVAVAFAFVSRSSKVARDWPGFVALTIPPVMWTFAYWWSWIEWTATDGAYGYEDGLRSGIVFAAVSSVPLIVVSWREHFAVNGHTIDPLPPADIGDAPPPADTA